MMSEAAKPENPGRGLHGSLDTPQDEIAPGQGFLVGGWVTHELCLISQVLVTVNGEVAGLAQVDVPRDDVLALHPDAPGAASRGWNVPVTPRLDPGGTITVRAYALTQLSRDEGRRLGPWVLFAERTVAVLDSGHHYGHIDDPGVVAPGAVRVTGTAWAPGGMTRIVLSVDDGEWIQARHSLPGVAYAAPDGPDALLGGFAGYVRVAGGSTSVTVRAAVVGRDGRRHELEPRVLTVSDREEAPIGATRLASGPTWFRQRMAGPSDPDRPARVLVGTHALDLGGAQLYLSFLLGHLQRRGLSICVVARRGGPLREDLEAAGIPVLIIGEGLASRDELESTIVTIASFAADNGARACLANTLLAFPAVAAAHILGLPTTWAIHESFDLDVFWSEALGRRPDDEVTEVAVQALREADEVVFEAEATSRLYADLVPPQRHALVRYGVDSAAIDTFVRDHTAAQARARLGLRQGSLVLACVGTVEARKGQLALVRAWNRIPAEQRAGVELLIVGMGSTPYSRTLHDYVEESGLTDSVHLLDSTPDIHQAYLAGDLLVSASDIESVPRTMLEAMLMRRPVASTAVFGVPELVVEGRNGFLCDPLDLDSLQHLVERVIATPRERLAAMGVAAREDVTRLHDPSLYIDHFWARLSGWLDESAD